MSCVYVDNLDARISEQELEDEFQIYGVIRRIWVARKPPGYAFIDFDDRRNDQGAIYNLDGKHNWRVKLSHYSRGSCDCSHSSGELSSATCIVVVALIPVITEVQASIPISLLL